MVRSSDMVNGLRVKGRVRIPAGAINAARILVVVMCCLLQAGCGGLLDTQRPAESRYWLEPVGVTGSAVADIREVELQLTVVPGLDTDRVLALVLLRAPGWPTGDRSQPSQ